MYRLLKSSFLVCFLLSSDVFAGLPAGCQPGAVNRFFQNALRNQQIFSNVTRPAIRINYFSPLPSLSNICQQVTFSEYDSLFLIAQYARNGKRVAVINAANASYPGGSYGNPHGDTGVQEEFLCALLDGLYMSLQQSGTHKKREVYQYTQRICSNKNSVLLYSPNLGIQINLQLYDAFLPASQEFWSNFLVQQHAQDRPVFSTTGFGHGLVNVYSLAAPNRQKIKGEFDYQRFYDEMYRMLSWVFVSAQQENIKILVLTLPGSGVFSYLPNSNTPDLKYLQTLANAIAQAIMDYGKNLRIVIPHLGQPLDGYLRKALGIQFPQMGVQTIVPSQKYLNQKSILVSPIKKDIKSFVDKCPAFKQLIQDPSTVTIRRALGLKPPSGGNQPYWFIGKDQRDSGKALVSIQDQNGNRQVYYVTFHKGKNPDLANRVSKARPY